MIIAPGPAPHAFPAWLLRLSPWLRELDANPLYWFLAGRAYGRRRWWNLGSPVPRIAHSGGGLAGRLIVKFFVAFFILVLLPQLFAPAMGRGISIGFFSFSSIIILFIVLRIWGKMKNQGTLAAFIKREQLSGCASQLLMIPLNSREWAMAWIGARLLKRPVMNLVGIAFVLSAWPVVWWIIRKFSPLASSLQGPQYTFLTWIPLMIIWGGTIAAVLLGIMESLESIRRELLLMPAVGFTQQAKVSAENSVRYLWFVIAYYVFPGFLWAITGRLITEGIVNHLLSSGIRDEWGAVIHTAGFFLIFTPLNCWGQTKQIIRIWKELERDFLPMLTDGWRSLEESKSESLK